MKQKQYAAILEQVVEIAIAAGGEILDVYVQEFDVQTKKDGSPLTAADLRADALICKQLQKIAPNIPILSEESDMQAFDERRNWEQYWLVDPLDGTKGFVRRNGEFTVNIALIQKNHPVLGVVYAPVKDIVYYAAVESGAFKVGRGSAPTRVCVKKIDLETVTMTVSRAHSDMAVETYRRALEKTFGRVKTTVSGSSLKICLVAEGVADIYPRLGATSEWDTGAAHCILEVAGGQITNLSGQPLRYNKENILNPKFLAFGDPMFDWLAFSRGME